MQIEVLPVANNPKRSLIRRHGKHVKEMEVGGEPSKVMAGVRKWAAGAYIQDALHMLNASEREFLFSGMLPAEWEKLFGKEE